MKTNPIHGASSFAAANLLRPAPRAGLFALMLGAMAILAVPAARAAVAFPMYVSISTQGSSQAFPVSIVQVSSAGVVSPFAYLPVSASPYGLAFDGSGNLYVADHNPDRIDRITPFGQLLSATLPAGSGPLGLAVDGSGNVYAADDSSGQISKITPGLVVSLFATLPAGSHPFGLAFDASGNLYAADENTGQISKITSSGALSLFATVPGGAGGLAFDGSGNLYAAGSEISKITSAGAVSLFASVNGAVGLAFDGSGNLYAVESGADQISKISPDGLSVSPFATGISYFPWFVAFGPDVPEPSSAVLLATAAGSLILRRRRSRA